MKLLWTMVKAAIVLALAIPLSIIALSTARGILGALLGVAIVALRLAVVGVIAWGAYRLVRWLVRKEPARYQAPVVRQLPPVDPYYDAAMRELDQELRTTN